MRIFGICLSVAELRLQTIRRHLFDVSHCTYDILSFFLVVSHAGVVLARHAILSSERRSWGEKAWRIPKNVCVGAGGGGSFLSFMLAAKVCSLEKPFVREQLEIIEFGFRRIWRILQIEEGVIHQDRNLQNSSYPTKAEFNNCFIISSK